MRYWKLGCRWGAKKDGFPLFFEMLQEHKILISWEDKDYDINTPVLLTDGHTTIGYGVTKSKAMLLEDFPNVENDLEINKISREYGLRIYEAEIYSIPKNLQFQYSLVQGICEIQQPEIINKFTKVMRVLNEEVRLEKVKSLLEYKKQIILQGPPGTGKTREAKLIAKNMLGLSTIKELEKNEHFKLLQFHPSYTYEDFVRGIVAESKGEKIEYKNVDKPLGIFAKEALKNFTDAQKAPEIISLENGLKEKYQSFKDKIEIDLETEEVFIKEGTKQKITAIENDAIRVNRYSNESDSELIKDSDIINGYNGLYISDPSIKVKDNNILSKSARSGMYYLYQNLIEKFKKYLSENNLSIQQNTETQKIDVKPFILIIDEINRANLSSVLGELIYALEYRGESLESMYEVDGSTKLILPPNLYIIGTMNTADRSVGHIDYAIRRRFAFVDVLPKKLDDENEELIFKSDLFRKISTLFISNFDEYIVDDTVKLKRSVNLSSEFRPEDIWLGHSYFIQKKENKEGKEILLPEDFSIRLKYEIKPILLEYVKDGILIGKVKNTDGSEKDIEQYIHDLK